MATNLRAKLPASDHLLLYDNLPASLKAFALSGNTEPVERLQDLAAADTIITMVPEGRHVEAIYSPTTGIFSELSSSSPQKNRLLVDCSTIDTQTSIKISQHCKSNHWGTFVDAPVSGGTKGAELGTLSFMVGADKVTDARLDPLLRHMGGTVHYCGKVGSGLAAKLCNNYLLALTNLATCEAMRMGIAMNLEPTVLGNVINSSTGKCWPSERNNPVSGITPGAPAERDFSGGFGIELMIKDLKLAIQAAASAGVELPSSNNAVQIYETVQQANSGQYSGKDFGIVYQYLKDTVEQY